MSTTRAGSCVLVVMAKLPRPGSVKTRLARHLGAERACDLYAAFLHDIAQRFAGSPWRLVWAVDPPGGDLTPFVGTGVQRMDQRGADLGQRMYHCFVDLFEAGAARVVMIGADAPHVDEGIVAAAFEALEANDLALVPSADGGYCLVALRAPHDVFSGIAMSTGAVLTGTCARADALGLRRELLEPSFDVDELEDVARLAERIAAGAVRLPRTAAILEGWRAAGLLRSAS